MHRGENGLATRRSVRELATSPEYVGGRGFEWCCWAVDSDSMGWSGAAKQTFVRWSVGLSSRSVGQGGDLDRVVLRTPQPHQMQAPSRPRSRARSQPCWHFSAEMRPSAPVRHLTSSTKPDSASSCWRVLPG